VIGLNEKGWFLLLVIILVFAVVLILPPVFLHLFPQAKILFALLMIFTIWGTVRMYLGDSVLTLIISGILAYLIVFKYLYLASSIYVFQLLLMVGFSSIVFFGVANVLSRH